MSKKNIGLGFGIAVITAALAGQASAGPSCHTGYGFGYSRTSAYAKPPVAKPAPVLASKTASKPASRVAAAVPQSGGEGEPSDVRAPVKAEPKVAQAPLVPSQKQALPETQPAPRQQAEAPAETLEDATSVSAVAARLAALAAQQAAAARRGATVTQ